MPYWIGIVIGVLMILGGLGYLISTGDLRKIWENIVTWFKNLFNKKGNKRRS